jgi:CRP/FNR family transcriptional regulator
MRLDEISVFASMGEAEIAEIKPYLSHAAFARRETIFSEGDAANWFYIVTKGRVKITKLSYEGKEIILEIIPPGNFFGGIAAMRNFPYPANAVAMEETEVIRISRENLNAILDKFPDVMLRITESLGDRMKESHETTKNIALEKVGARIATLLLKLAEKSGTETPEGIAIEIKLTKQDIAEMVGTTVETSIRTMSAFKKAGLVGEEGGRIVIRNRSGLEGIVGL